MLVIGEKRKLKLRKESRGRGNSNSHHAWPYFTVLYFKAGKLEKKKNQLVPFTMIPGRNKSESFLLSFWDYQPLGHVGFVITL